jgi:hypothetical protein
MKKLICFCCGDILSNFQTVDLGLRVTYLRAFTKYTGYERYGGYDG